MCHRRWPRRLPNGCVRRREVEMKNLLLAKTFAVADAVAGANGEISFAELSEKLAIPGPTLSRITADLVEAGMIEKHGRSIFRPSFGMVRIGQQALRSSPLRRQVEPPLRERAAMLEVNGIFAVMHRDELIFLCRTDGANLYSAPVSSDYAPWRSGLALVILAARGDRTAGEEWLKRVINRERYNPRRELETFRRRFDEAVGHGYLLLREVGRRWSVCFPVGRGNDYHAVGFFGDAPERRNFDRLTFECSLLASRLASLFRER